jgi:hypothetical protein
MSERQGVEIDYCPQCRGVWLDRNELDKIIEKSMAKAVAGELASAARGESRLQAKPLSVTYLPDAGGTAFYFTLTPVLPPRQRIFVKKGRWAHLLKIGVEHYTLWKMRHGMTRLPG